MSGAGEKGSRGAGEIKETTGIRNLGKIVRGRAIKSHLELEVYKMAFDAAMKIFEISKSFPKEEKYSLTDQIRRASRSVCGNVAEAWRKRRYENAFVSKLNDSEGESAETQTWIQFSVKCGYLPKEVGKELYHAYDQIIGKLVTMINNPYPWLLTNRPPRNN